MSDLNKIPFGLRVADEEIVDVCEVPNGSRCGCICPSCQMPLQAKQGNINQWHFAHDSQHAHEQTKTVCTYSFYPSVRLMAKQVVGEGFQLDLPGLTGQIAYYQGVRWSLEYKAFKVTDPATVVIERPAIDTSFSGASVDIVGTIKDFQFVIFFSQPDRVVPESLFEPENPKCGILEISLNSLFNEFLQKISLHKTYREILTDFLQHDVTSKKWIYHPRFKSKANQATEDLQRRGNILDYRVIPINGKVAPMSANLIQEPITINRTVRFKCVMCRVQWEGLESGGNRCPKCQEYLYTKIVD